MKQFFTFCILVCCSAVVLATHNKGGYITYKYLGNYTYEATVTTFTKVSPPSDAADRPSLTISWGNGQMDTIARINGGGNGEMIAPDIKKNIYTGTYQYSGPGDYIISVADPNRNAGIVNLPADSDQIPLYLESYLIISPFSPGNNSIEFLLPNVFTAIVGTKFTINPTASNKDGDCLLFELVTPKGTGGTEIPGYFLPNGITINKNTGEITWETPNQQGQFVFVIKVSEWRNNVMIGYVTFDFLVTVTGNVTNNALFINADSWNKDSEGTYFYTIAPGDSLSLSLTYSDTSASIINLSASGEPFLFSSNPATFFTINNGDSMTGSFFWKPNSAANRAAPYIIIFRGESDGYVKDITLMVQVDSVGENSCNLPLRVNELMNSSRHVTIHPNPFKSKATITINTPLSGENRLAIYNYRGQIIKAYTNVSNSILLSAFDFTKGIYFYTIEAGASVFTGKFIVE